MPDAYDPRAPEAVADDARVATGVDHRAVDSEPLEHRDAPIDRVSLRNAPEVDANAGLPESHGMRFGVQLDMAVVDARQSGRDSLGVGVHTRAIVVQVAHARVGDVERAAGELRVLDRGCEQVVEFA